MGCTPIQFLREIYTVDEILKLLDDRGFSLVRELVEHSSGESILCLSDDSDDGPPWHVFFGSDKDLYEGFDLVCFRPTAENPYLVANDWNEKHYKSVITVLSDSDNNSIYVHPYFAVRLCSTVDFQQLVTVGGFDRHLTDWLADVDEAIERFPYEPESIVGDAQQNPDN